MVGFIFALQDLKLKYYQLMIALGEHEDAYLTISRHYQAVLDTPLVKEDPVKRQEVSQFLPCLCSYLPVCLSVQPCCHPW
jgi:26S proteasome regulatory subunit N5